MSLHNKLHAMFLKLGKFLASLIQFSLILFNVFLKRFGFQHKQNLQNLFNKLHQLKVTLEVNSSTWLLVDKTNRINRSISIGLYRP